MPLIYRSAGSLPLAWREFARSSSTSGSHLWITRRHRGLLLEHADKSGAYGWLNPRFAFFPELPARFGIKADLVAPEVHEVAQGSFLRKQPPEIKGDLFVISHNGTHALGIREYGQFSGTAILRLPISGMMRTSSLNTRPDRWGVLRLKRNSRRVAQEARMERNKRSVCRSTGRRVGGLIDSDKLE
jgi:hypothetical protein